MHISTVINLGVVPLEVSGTNLRVWVDGVLSLSMHDDNALPYFLDGPTRDRKYIG